MDGICTKFQVLLYVDMSGFITDMLTPGLSPAKILCRLNLTRISIKILNQVAIVAFCRCSEEQIGQFGILVLVSKA